MAAKKAKKKRIRSPHPGVRLRSRVLPSGTKAWSARYRDPDTGRERDIALGEKLGLSSHEARRTWAIEFAKTLAARRREIAAGIKRAPRVGLEDAVEAYLTESKHRLRPRTVTSYRESLERLKTWAKGAGVAHVHGLTPARLAALRAVLVASKKHTAKKNGKRGSKVKRSLRSPATVNRDLRHVGAFLNQVRRLGFAPQLSRDTIADSLRPVPTERRRPAFLPPEDCQALLEAVLRHDQATFKITRNEHDGEGQPGMTPRFEPVAPFVAFVMLSGCRVGEALGLEWDDVNLEALDEHGTAVGEIRLRPSAVKTRTERIVDLSVSPALRAILGARRLRTGTIGSVFNITQDQAVAVRRRLLKNYGAPTFSWQALRSTCATYLVNAPGIFGAAAPFRAARQLGHSVTVAERHYVGLLRGIPREASTLEEAMQIGKQTGFIVESLSARGAQAEVGR